MKTTLHSLHALVLGLSLALALAAVPVHGVIIVPGADGSDGALNITTNTVIDLSQAVTAAWDANNTANAGKGVYDSNQWAVVFKYSGVTIAEGATVTFKNHPSRAPVVWLSNGDVRILGALSMDGQSYRAAPGLPEPGPGGFRGGSGFYSSGVGSASGFGPGGGGWHSSGSYGTQGETYPAPGFQANSTYGNPSIVPLLGGSGGGHTGNTIGGSGAGGGAILIACAGTLTIVGEVRANGGSAAPFDGSAGSVGGGSGGGIRLITDRLVGTGAVKATGVAGGMSGGLGRIRIERVLNENSITVVPDPSVVNLTTGSTALIWPPDGSPQVRIISIAGKDSPSDPRAEFGTVGADLILPQASSTAVVIETINVEQTSQVIVRGTPRSGGAIGGNFREAGAAVDTVVSANPLIIRWMANLPVDVGYSAVQVKVIRP